MDEVECPYCGKDVEINHDDGTGYREEVTYDQECRYCEKTFIYTVQVSYDYEASKAPCLNGEEHDWRDQSGYPKEYFAGRQYCNTCDKKRKI